jgi:hypothetical protein
MLPMKILSIKLRGCQAVKLVNPDNVFAGEKKTVQDAFGNTIEVEKKKGHLKGADLIKEFGGG